LYVQGIVVFLGVPDEEVLQEENKDIEASGFAFTHHQLLQDHGSPLGNGNNMFISISSPNDTERYL
jgi:hypothetical protein